MQTAYDLVRLAAQRYPDHSALVDDRSERKLTYRELIEEVDVVAAGLVERGVRPGMRVATVLPNVWEHCLLLLALPRLGAVPAVMNVRLTGPELAGMIEQGEIEGAVVPSDAKLAESIAQALPAGATLMSVGGKAGAAEDFATCRGAPEALPPIPLPEREQEAYIFYTSGTSGLPKGVVIPHRAVEHRLLWISPLTGVRFGTHLRSLGISPLSHAIGFFCVYLLTLAFNGTYYVQSAFDPSKAVELVERHRINYLFSVPTIFHMMMVAANYRSQSMASLEHVLFGGAPTPATLINRMAEEWPAALRHIYGLTESMCSLYNAEPVERPTVLRAPLYTRIRVVKIGGTPGDEVSPGEEGELIVDASADIMFSGYLNRPDADAEKLRDGWYFTGDVCRLLENNEVDLRGRVDDVIRSGGENVHPEEVEAALISHPGVREAAVIGVTDSQWGQMVVACIVGSGAASDVAELDAHCRAGTLARFKRPRGYVFPEILPRNAANKVLRRVLVEQVSAAREGGGALEFHPVAGS